jgi:hypothetical protein
MFSLGYFIEELIIHNVAVLSYHSPFCLEIYPNSIFRPFRVLPFQTRLKYEFNSTFQELFENTKKFFLEFINFHTSANTIPNDPKFPLASSALSFHRQLMDEFYKEIAKYPEEKPITASNINQIFDSTGKILDPEQFNHRLYHAGCDDDILPRLIPFIVGAYPLESSEAERLEILSKFEKHFQTLLQQTESLQSFQLLHDPKKHAAFGVINQDVHRTDRTHPAFQNLEGPAPKTLTTLLKVFAVFNPNISYLQGMNDLFVPILLAFYPNWDSNGNPIDNEGNIVDLEPKIPLFFFIFDYMLKKTGHIKVIFDVTNECRNIAGKVLQVLEKISPLTAIWIKRHNLNELLWLYSDFVLMFKRSFEKIWTIWIDVIFRLLPTNGMIIL